MSFYLLLPCVLQHCGSASPAHRVLPRRLQGVGNSWRVLPVKRRLFSTVKSILQLLDEICLPRQSEKAFLLQPPLSDEIHTLLHQHGSQAVPIALLVPDSVFQLLPKNTCTKNRALAQLSTMNTSEEPTPSVTTHAICRSFKCLDN